jgi:hypothetical protein
VAGELYLRQGRELVALVRQRFTLESDMQELLADHPALVAGEAPEGMSRRWLLITREAGVADAPEAPDRWSIDHLFVDDGSVPTLVEVKRASDTRLRREVVGQLLDYAAHAALYWNAATLRQSWEASQREASLSPDETLAAELGVEDAEAFWQAVDENLRAGRMRLVFVADEVPRELQRVVEFLNERMVPTEVLAIEFSQYKAGDEQVLMPRLLGQTVAATDLKKRISSQPKWTEDELRAGFEALSEPSRTAGLKIFDHLLRTATRSVSGKGKAPVMYFFYETDGRVRFRSHAELNPDKPSFDVPFNSMRQSRVAADQLEAIWRRFSEIPGLAPLLEHVPDAEYRKQPRIPLRDVLDQDGVATEFCRAIDDVSGNAASTPGPAVSS